MSGYFNIVLILLALAYLVSPIDLLPDLHLPLLGWIDDTALIGLVLYYLRYRRLPGFFFRNTMSEFSRQDQRRTNDDQNRQDRAQGNDSGQKKAHERDRYHSQDTDSGPDRSPYDVLGVSEKATRDEITKAYRQLVKQYHPDRVSHLGKELQELASRKMAEINEAYRKLVRS